MRLNCSCILGLIAILSYQKAFHKFWITATLSYSTISPNNLYKWKEQYEEGRLVPGMKQAQPTPQEAEALTRGESSVET